MAAMHCFEEEIERLLLALKDSTNTMDSTVVALGLVADSDKFMHSLAESWANLVESVQKKGGYTHILAASGSFGKNMLPRAAALLDISPVTDVVGISGSHQFVRIPVVVLLRCCPVAAILPCCYCLLFAVHAAAILLL